MVSFKLKLVAYFVLLTLVPLGAAFWGFDSLARRSGARSADVRLEADLRSALNAYQAEAAAVGSRAARLAGDRALQAALRTRDRVALRAFVANRPDVRVETGSIAVGSRPAGALSRTVAVVSKGRVLGNVVVSLPVDRSLLAAVGSRAALDPHDRLAFSRGGRVIAGPTALVGARLTLHAGKPAPETVAGERLRVLSAPALDEPHGISLTVLGSQSSIDAAVRASDRRLVLVLASLLVLAGVVAYLLSRSIVRTLGGLAAAAGAIAEGRLGERVPERGRDEFGRLARAFNEMASQLESRALELESERGRLARTTARMGDALAATHEPDQLLAVVVATAVEATGAYGGAIVDAEGRELVRSGDPEAGLKTIRMPLQAAAQSFGTLVLAGPGFGPEASETAASLAAQAVVALENARLHRIVEQQALVDALTGLANRRASEEALHAELQRAGRFGGEVALVMADLDGFKGINDRHGHSAGDVVLRVFAELLAESVREIDVAGRWGGEEFCLVLAGTDADGGAVVAERARAALEARAIPVPGGAAVRVTASFGVASYPARPGKDELVEAADAALYAAKRAGKNRVEVAPAPIVRPG